MRAAHRGYRIQRHWRASSPKESGQIWLRSERILTQISFIQRKCSRRQDTQPNRNTKSRQISGEENLSQLFYCERDAGPVEHPWTHLVQHPPLFQRRAPGPQHLNVNISDVKCKWKQTLLLWMATYFKLVARKDNKLHIHLRLVVH